MDGWSRIVKVSRCSGGSREILNHCLVLATQRLWRLGNWGILYEDAL